MQEKKTRGNEQPGPHISGFGGIFPSKLPWRPRNLLRQSVRRLPAGGHAFFLSSSARFPQPFTSTQGIEWTQLPFSYLLNTIKVYQVAKAVSSVYYSSLAMPCLDREYPHSSSGSGLCLPSRRYHRLYGHDRRKSR